MDIGEVGDLELKDTLLFASVFDAEVRVPHAWVTAMVSVRKVKKAIGGTAGPKRRRSSAHAMRGLSIPRSGT